MSYILPTGGGRSDRLASTRDEAIIRADYFEKLDPFPSVSPSLLSAAEIQDYALLTAMLYPFEISSLKSASYEVRAGGRFIYWDENEKKHDVEIDRSKRGSIRLPANSISFVQTEPTFRLPYYIAVRFNLRITHVHRGLLLGTGPLVDPGFHGQLLIPLHNLTSSDYYLNLYEALIWVEFTKTTYNHQPKETYASTIRNVPQFPGDKKNRDPDYYFDKANKNFPIGSSIPQSIGDAKRSAASAARDAEKAARWWTRIGWAAGLGVIITMVSLIYSSYSLTKDTVSLVQSTRDASTASVREASIALERAEASKKVADEASDEARDAARTIRALEGRIQELSRDVDALMRARLRAQEP